MKKNSVSETTKPTEQSEQNATSSRRSFMKKAVYVAPTLLALGALTRPTDAKAANFGRPPSGPTW